VEKPAAATQQWWWDLTHILYEYDHSASCWRSVYAIITMISTMACLIQTFHTRVVSPVHQEWMKIRDQLKGRHPKNQSTWGWWAAGMDSYLHIVWSSRPKHYISDCWRCSGAIAYISFCNNLLYMGQNEICICTKNQVDRRAQLYSILGGKAAWLWWI
jgi:hypothetical protein